MSSSLSMPSCLPPPSIRVFHAERESDEQEHDGERACGADRCIEPVEAVVRDLDDDRRLARRLRARPACARRLERGECESEVEVRQAAHVGGTMRRVG